MKKFKLLALGATISALMASNAQAQTYTWDKGLQAGVSAGTSSVATIQDDAASGKFLTLKGYSWNFDKLNPPATPAIGGTEDFGTLTAANLGWAADSNDHGVGIQGSANWVFQPENGYAATPPDNEIRPDQFVAVDATSLKAQGLSSLTFNISSMDASPVEGSLIYGIANGSTVGTLLYHVTSPGSAGDVYGIQISSGDLAKYDAFLVTADRAAQSFGSSPVLPYSSVVITNGVTATFSTPPVPEPDEYVLMMLGAGLVAFQIKRKKAASA
jgi:hypothetical protein